MGGAETTEYMGEMQVVSQAECAVKGKVEGRIWW